MALTMMRRPPAPCGAPAQPEQCEIVRFGRSRRKNDFVRVRIDERCYTRGSLLDSLGRLPSEAVIDGMWISERLRKYGVIWAKTAAVYRGCRLMIKIDGLADSHGPEGAMSKR